MAEQYCVGSEQGRAVRLEGRMIIHSKSQQHGLCSIWDMPAQYNGLIRIMVVVTGFVFLQVILSICTLNRIQYLQVFFLSEGCFSVDMEPMQELFLFVYTKHNPTENAQLLWLANHLFFCSVFSIHEICIFWLFLSDMIKCVSHLIGSVVGRLAE